MPAEPVPIRPAATILLMRDAPEFQVLMVKRHHQIDFASGALVFPGGRVDAADGAPSMLEHCRAVPGIDAAALAFRVAGIRESFEEAHVLLARPRGSERLLTAPELDALEAEARAKLGRDPLLGDLVAGGEIELAADLLVPFAHWITPVGPPKRFDTHFFLAPAPADQHAAHDGREAVDTIWIAPQAAVAEADAKRVTLVFATRMNLLKLARSADVAAALAAARDGTIVTVCPEVAQSPAGTVLRIPLSAGYGVTEVRADITVRAWVPRS
jgi:8-oxo-dGTP pyrophosphatase MutT (NUDIX family)